MSSLFTRLCGWHCVPVMKSTSFKMSGQSGFSLVELLVVIAVIAIIAAIAIPNIANITTQARYAKDQRNAQNIASVASAAKAAGVADNLSQASTATIALLEAGLTSTNGGQVLTFGISPLTTAEETGALNHLTNNGVANGALVYSPTTNAY
jgi:type IV pilus assembly protein PilA